MSERTFTDDKLKAIPMILSFAPILENEIRKWDGKVLNKKFYLAMETFARDWFLQSGLKEENDELSVFVSYNNYVCNGKAGELTLIYNHFSCSLLYTTDVTEWARIEEGKAPRVNAEALVKDLSIHMEREKRDYEDVKRTLNHEEEIRKMYQLIAELSQKFSDGEYDEDTLLDKLGLNRMALRGIDAISFYSRP